MTKKHNVLTGADLHEPKGVASATSGTVYVADGASSGAWQNVKPSNVTIVSDASDFPTPAANVITLVGSTIYLIDGAIDIGDDEIVMAEDTALYGLDHANASITSTTTNSLITSTNVSCRIESVDLVCSSGSAFDFDGTGTETINLRRSDVTCDIIGNVDDLLDFKVADCDWSAASAGLTFANAGDRCELLNNAFAVTATNGTCLDFGTVTFNHIHIHNCDFENPTGTGYGIDVAAAGANLNSGKSGVIAACTFTNTGNASNYDGGIRWIVDSSPGVTSSRATAQGYILNNATTTTFAGTGAGNDVEVGWGAGFTADIQNKFTISTAGVFTYVGEQNIDVFVEASIYATIGGGASRTYNWYIAKNGTIIASSVSQRAYDGTNAGSNTCSSIVNIDNGDTITLRVRAETATTALTADTVSTKIITLE